MVVCGSLYEHSFVYMAMMDCPQLPRTLASPHDHFIGYVITRLCSLVSSMLSKLYLTHTLPEYRRKTPGETILLWQQFTKEGYTCIDISTLSVSPWRYSNQKLWNAAHQWVVRVHTPPGPGLLVKVIGEDIGSGPSGGAWEVDTTNYSERGVMAA